LKGQGVTAVIPCFFFSIDSKRQRICISIPVTAVIFRQLFSQERIMTKSIRNLLVATVALLVVAFALTIFGEITFLGAMSHSGWLWAVSAVVVLATCLIPIYPVFTLALCAWVIYALLLSIATTSSALPCVAFVLPPAMCIVAGVLLERLIIASGRAKFLGRVYASIYDPQYADYF
jgi:hypothetical protein